MICERMTTALRARAAHIDTARFFGDRLFPAGIDEHSILTIRHSPLPLDAPLGLQPRCNAARCLTTERSEP